MVELTIDGKTVSVPDGSMVMHAANELGIYVPHFCYHKKLSIAANCRMCLVEVEKAPKALPACATPVTNGMVVHTNSEKAQAAQKAVMEFLLINHPLDCPICDQGGECQLQDLSMGYGKTHSRFGEEKRVVMHKSMGPLVSAEEMSRCIQCTRCVRFGQEIAGQMELGMLNRGEHSQITSFVGRAVESELSGNMIDICPVGALTSKPFRYSARTWELARRRSVSPHDSLGANLVVQVKGDRVMRVVPFENEDVNECWISDKDRWSYEGLNSEDRLTVPMVRDENNVWREVSWQDALKVVADAFEQIARIEGPEYLGALATETSTLEELALLKRVMSGLGSSNVDALLRNNDSNFARATEGAPWLGMSIRDLDSVDGVVVIGSYLRKDHPLMAQRLRQAAKKGARITLIDSYGEDPLFPVAARLTVAPSELAKTVEAVAKAVAAQKSGAEADLSDPVQALAAQLVGGSKPAVFLGNAAVAAPDASQIAAKAQELADAYGATLGFLTAGANTVGAYITGAVAQGDGLSAKQMIENQLKAYLVLHAEPKFDMDNGLAAEKTLSNAFGVALTAYKSAAADWAKVMLPIAPFTETSGTFVNAEGRAQSFKGVVASKGQSRPAWKVLRVLGNMLQFGGFEQESSEQVRDEVIGSGIAQYLNNKVTVLGQEVRRTTVPTEGLQRVAEVAIYRTDATVRRAAALQATAISQTPKARLNAVTLSNLQIADGDKVKVKSAVGEGEFIVQLDDNLADDTIRLAQGFDATVALGNAYAQLTVERI
ncbi:NADH-quinone oxidoreductase subunit NuoG [Pelistega europaea]|uniref:NADH-quinone oxidoreductase n=1 Tax=Pelistega europaea TaxID=106147 RepID=A0A7Y4LAW6_9BURK|nr:NADH-quinone oxidoreductase subunit NuoG [Pelistega europaea]NOL50209.1 NADH-quinone oxidoreductase subunit G [Pelistega europaea]